MESLDRRRFLAGSAAFTASLLLPGAARTLHAYAWTSREGPTWTGSPYGTPRPKRARNTGEKLLALPPGFSYVVMSVTGCLMDDGAAAPIAYDGMAAFRGPGGVVRLIRNHEVRTGPGTPAGRVRGPEQSAYDPVGVGGTTTVDFDARSGRVNLEFVSLNGTSANCAGGPMLGGTGWISCEETTAGRSHGWGRSHGYCFAVPLEGPDPGSPAVAVPLKAMGRFSHEAVAVDPASGFVYLTEDQRDVLCGFYRFRPSDPRRLEAGGALEMLKVKGRDRYDTRENQTVDAELAVEWVVIDDPDPDLEAGDASCSAQGRAKGAAAFNRLEGCCFSKGTVWFTSTSGGSTKSGDSDNVESVPYRRGYGQVWRYVPSHDGGTLILAYESTAPMQLDSPDNLTITPRGGILVCEDDDTSDADRHPSAPHLTNVNRLVGIGHDGMPFEFAVNIDSTSEFAGVCFSPDGEILFVNHFGNRDALDPPGRTYAITGPWRRGPL